MAKFDIQGITIFINVIQSDRGANSQVTFLDVKHRLPRVETLAQEGIEILL
jgi:hypothetical protein